MAGAVQRNARFAIVVLVTVGTAPEWPIVVADCGRPLGPGVGDGNLRHINSYHQRGTRSIVLAYTTLQPKFNQTIKILPVHCRMLFYFSLGTMPALAIRSDD